MPAPGPLLETRSLTKEYPVSVGVRRTLRRERDSLVAVDDVSISIERGRTLGIVGESGSGKSTLGRLLLRLERPTAGEIFFDGAPLAGRDARGDRELRKRIQVVFQDPYASLNPTMTVRQALGEALAVHGIATRAERRARVDELLDRVGLGPELADRKPHQFSGGQRQRIGIARSLAVEPDFIVADEAVSALDVSVQAQVLNLFMRLQDDLGLTYMFISHNLSVLRHVSERIAVMYLGRVVEQASTEQLFAEPLHPYTQALFQAAPKPVPKRKEITPAVGGDIPSPIERPSGCHFHPRCPFAMDICRAQYPPLLQTGGGRSVACHLHTPATAKAG